MRTKCNITLKASSQEDGRVYYECPKDITCDHKKTWISEVSDDELINNMHRPVYFMCTGRK